MLKVVEKLTDDSSNATPFRLTKQEKEMLDPNYKKPAKRKRALLLINAAATAAASDEDIARRRRGIHQRLHKADTTASKLKHRVSEEIDEIWAELETSTEDTKGGKKASTAAEKGGGGGGDEEEEDDFDDEDSDAGGGGGTGQGKKAGALAGIAGVPGVSSTYALASLRRASEKCEGLKEFVESSRSMFILRYTLSVKHSEKRRLERVLREEESQLAKAEAELRLAQQAFDQFLQEKDRNAVEAQKKADGEMRSRLEKTADIKELDDSILGLKRQISKLKDQLAEYATFESFLYSLSPEAWRQVQESKSKSANKTSTGIDSKATERQMEDKSLKSVSMAMEKEAESGDGKEGGGKPEEGGGEEDGKDGEGGQDEDTKQQDTPSATGTGTSATLAAPPSESDLLERKRSLEIAADHLHVSTVEFDSVGKEVKLYFREPSQLLSIFTDLEDENLKLIEQCQEAEDRLEEVRETTKKSRDRLTNQVVKFERDIDNLESQIAKESDTLLELEDSVQKRKKEHGKGAKEDEILEGLEHVVITVHDRCVGESRSPVSTLEKLKRLELRMEMLTKELDLLPPDKVKVAQRTCERERRQREDESRQEKHRQQHAERNRRALDRALAPPFVKPELRRFQPPKDILEQRRRRLRRLRIRMQKAEEEEAGWDGGDGTGGGGGGGEGNDEGMDQGYY